MVERIPQAFIDDLIDRSDITEIIGKRIEIKKAGKEYKACCPFHNEKTPSFSVNPEMADWPTLSGVNVQNTTMTVTAPFGTLEGHVENIST